MSREEVRRIEDLFIPYDGLGKMKTFHNKESREVIVIIYDPNILGITKLKDILTLNQEALRNLNLYFKTREEKQLESIIGLFRKYKTIIEAGMPLQQYNNELSYKIESQIQKANQI